LCRGPQEQPVADPMGAICVFIYVYIYTYIYIYTCIHVYIYIHIYMYTCIHIYIYIYISDVKNAMPPQEQPVADPMGAPKIKATPCQALAVRVLRWSRVGVGGRGTGV
jgi:hypothetical protein